MYPCKALLAAVVLFAWTATAHAGLINGDFSGGSTGWSSQGSAQFLSGGFVMLRDNSVSRLWQPVQLGHGTYKLQFDLWLNMAGPNGDAGRGDLGWAGLYFQDDISTFAYYNYDQLIGLQTFDGPISSGGWHTYEFTFDNDFNYVIPYFLVQNLNGSSSLNDSMMMIDNVRITSVETVVPEPASLLLIGGGLAGLGFIRRKRSV